MATSSTYYIDSSSFNTATSVYTNQELTNKAPDGYYSIAGLYRKQLFGKLQDVISCNGEPVVDCVVSEWSEWSTCADGFETRTRTVITPASNGGVECPVLEEQRPCPLTCINYTLWTYTNAGVTYLDCEGIEQSITIGGISGYDSRDFCAIEGSYSLAGDANIFSSGYC